MRSWSHGRASAEREVHEPRIVFDGEPHEHAPDLVRQPHPDDATAGLADTLAGPVCVVTSDRALRTRLSRAERALAGGGFVRAALGG